MKKSKLPLFIFVIVLAALFAMVEIQIEGTAGWAKNLPTWRIEKHILLDIFWGGRAMTGYHFWVFPFIFLMFHLPIFFISKITFEVEARILGSIIFFWLLEDFLWFVLNPGYGLSKFSAEYIPWHPRWFLGVPIDYVYFGLIGVFLFFIYRDGLIKTIKSDFVKK